MGFSEFEICFLDENDNPEPAIEMQADTDDPARGDWIDVRGRCGKVVEVRHIENPGERTPRSRTRCYVREQAPPAFFRKAPSSVVLFPGPQSGGAKLLSIPSHPRPSAIAVQDESDKKVRAVSSGDPFLAKTFERPLSKTTVERQFAMRTQPGVARWVMSNGVPIEEISDDPAPELAITEEAEDVPTRVFVAEEDPNEKRPTLRLYKPSLHFSKSPIPVADPSQPLVPAPVPATSANDLSAQLAPIRARSHIREFVIPVSGLVLGTCALAWVLAVLRNPKANTSQTPTVAAPTPQRPRSTPLTVTAPVQPVQSSAPPQVTHEVASAPQPIEAKTITDETTRPKMRHKKGSATITATHENADTKTKPVSNDDDLMEPTSEDAQ